MEGVALLLGKMAAEKNKTRDGSANAKAASLAGELGRIAAATMREKLAGSAADLRRAMTWGLTGAGVGGLAGALSSLRHPEQDRHTFRDAAIGALGGGLLGGGAGLAYPGLTKVKPSQRHVSIPEPGNTSFDEVSSAVSHRAKPDPLRVAGPESTSTATPLPQQGAFYPDPPHKATPPISSEDLEQARGVWQALAGGRGALLRNAGIKPPPGRYGDRVLTSLGPPERRRIPQVLVDTYSRMAEMPQADSWWNDLNGPERHRVLQSLHVNEPELGALMNSRTVPQQVLDAFAPLLDR